MVKNELPAMCPQWVFQEPSKEQDIVKTDIISKALKVLKCRVFISIKAKLGKEQAKVTLCILTNAAECDK